MTAAPPLGTPVLAGSSIPEQPPGGPADLVALEPTRAVTAWDACGVLVLASLMLGVNQLLVAWAGTPLGDSAGIRRASLAVAVVTAVAVVAQMMRDGTPPSRLPADLTAVWRDPPRPAAAFVFGGLLALPVLGLYSPVLFNDSDSARLLASILYVQRGHLDYFAQTQEPFLPHLVLGPPMYLGGMRAVKVTALFTVLVLSGVLSYVAYRLTRTMWAAAGTAVGLLALAPIYERAVRLPLYPLMLTLVTLGGWLAYRAMTDGRHQWRYAVGAGVCLALAPEAQAVGQLFLATPLLVAVFAPSVRDAVRSLVRIFGVMAVASLPRLLVNLSMGGLSHLTSYRTDYWITEGYVVEIQNRYWGYPGVSEPLGGYLDRLPGRIVETLGAGGWVVLVAALLGALIYCGWRARLFVAIAGGFFLLSITVKQIPPYPRYYSPIWPGMVLLCGALAAAAAGRGGALARHGRRWGLLLGPLCLLVLSVSAVRSYDEAVGERNIERASVYKQPASLFAHAIDDGKGVIGARAHQLLFSMETDILTWGDQFLSEKEYVTYLTWPSDQAVLDVLDRHDIGWVIIHSDRKLETDYNNTWLVPHYGVSAHHIDRIGQSGNFCRWLEAGAFVLFKVGPCPPGRLPAGVAERMAAERLETPPPTPSTLPPMAPSPTAPPGLTDDFPPSATASDSPAP